MQILLSIPFRTTINLNPRFIARRTPLFVQELNRAALSIEKSFSNLRVTSLALHDESTHGLYTTIGDDVLPPCVLPLLTMSWAADQLNFTPISTPAGVEAADLESATLRYFDHTVGILELIINLRNLKDETEFSELLDQWSYTLANQWINNSTDITAAVEKNLASIKLSNQSICFSIGSENAYFDWHEKEKQDPQKSLLWVSRVLIPIHRT
jgi:hypothetical protein